MFDGAFGFGSIALACLLAPIVAVVASVGAVVAHGGFAGGVAGPLVVLGLFGVLAVWLAVAGTRGPRGKRIAAALAIWFLIAVCGSAVLLVVVWANLIGNALGGLR